MAWWRGVMSDMQAITAQREHARGWGSPLYTLAGVLVLVAVVFSITLWQATHRPWLGVETSPNGDQEGVEVVSVWPDGPAAGILAAGDMVTGIGTAAGDVLPVGPDDLVVDPDMFPTFASLNAFLQRQGRLAAALAAPVTLIATADGRMLKVQTRSTRPLKSLPPDFWAFQIYGAIAILVGVWVWVTAGQRLPAFLILVSGFAYVLSTASASLIVVRELALPAADLHNLILAFHLGNNLFSLSLIALLWHYPRRVGGRWLLWLFAAWLAFAWLNEHYQWLDLPGHNVGFQVTVVMLTGLVAVVRQWRATRGHPADRAVIKFFLFALVLINIIVLVSYYHAAWLVGTPLMPLAASLGLAGLFYLALVIGVARCRMFDVERWWLYIWLWLAAGVAILGLDILVSMLVPGLGQYSLVLVLVLVGWAYFPLRQWLWARVFPSTEGREVLQLLPDFSLRLVTGRDPDPESAWSDLLRAMFSPLEMVRVERTSDVPCLRAGGECLYVPGLRNEGYELKLANHGARLFHSQDLELARTLHGIASGLKEELERHREGVARERERIMRDLHDDVGGRLLTLIHGCTDRRAAETAREALEALRDVIYLSADGDARLELDEVVARWHRLTRKRLERAGVRLNWRWDPDSMTELRLRATEMLNLGRILQEAVSNALRHARPEEIRITGWIEGHALRVEIHNDGVGELDTPAGEQSHRGGQGRENMRRRTEELGGSLTMESSGRTYRVELVLPIERFVDEDRGDEAVPDR